MIKKSFGSTIMEIEEVESKPYHEIIRETKKARIFLGKKFFTGEFRYFVATVLSTNVAAVTLLVFSAIVVG